MDDLLPYLKTSDVFFVPGTGRNAFQFYPLGKLADIENPAETVIGTMDSGRGWIVYMYADGHVVTKPK